MIEPEYCQRLRRAVQSAVDRHPSDWAIVLALSGGRDSSTLLHILTDLYPGERLRAVHINHGIASESDRWEQFCRELCQARGIAFSTERLPTSLLDGGNFEAKARYLRYRALYRLVSAPTLLLTAHHRDDQVETYLYRQLRGTGVYGAGAMAPESVSPVDGVRLLRPLLSVAARDIELCADELGVSYCDDPLNQDTRYQRNWLRHELLPILKGRVKAIDAIIASNASLMRQTRWLCEDLAHLDYRNLQLTISSQAKPGFALYPEPASMPVDHADAESNERLDRVTIDRVEIPTFELRSGHRAETAEATARFATGAAATNADDNNAFLKDERVCWSMAALHKLAPYRIDNLLNCFVRARSGRPLRAGQLASLRQWLAVKSSEYRHISVCSINFRCWRGRIYVDTWRDDQLQLKSKLFFSDPRIEAIDNPPFNKLPQVVVQTLRAQTNRVTIRSRRPGDSLRANGRRLKLKKLLNEHAVEPWLRDRVPVICLDDCPVALALPQGWFLAEEFN